MSDYSATFPSQRPVFSQDFAQSGKIDPRATFSRSDSPIDTGKAAAAAVHYWSNEKHLSSENLIPNSNASQAWQTVRVTRTTSGSFLDGSNSFLIAEKSDTGSHYTSPNSSVNATNFVSGTEYTAVVYAKAGTDNVIQLAFSAGYFTSNAYANFDLSNASTTPVTGSAATATITALGSDWVKLTLTAPATATGAAVGVVVAFIENDINGARIPVYAGDTASNVYIWEANVSSTGQTVLDPTSGQIHRAYAPTLKSPATAGDPRFEHDPATNVSRGILLESQSTNELLYSENFDEGYWQKNRTTIQNNAGVSPVGDLTADLITANTTGADESHNVLNAYTFTSGETHTFSVFAKAYGTISKVRLKGGNSSTWPADSTFTLSGSGSFTSTVGTASIESCGNGWYRCSVTGTASASATTARMISLVSASGSMTFDGDSYSGLLIWGAQFEESSFASSYVQTLLSAKTRASDQLSITDSSLFTGNEGTIAFEGQTLGGSTGFGRFWSVSDGTNDNRIHVYPTSSTVVRFRVYRNNIEQRNVASGVTDVTQSNRYAFAYEDNKLRLAQNGSLITDDSNSAVMPVVNKLSIGMNGSGSGNQMNGHIKRIAFYGQSLSDTEMTSLSS